MFYIGQKVRIKADPPKDLGEHCRHALGNETRIVGRFAGYWVLAEVSLNGNQLCVNDAAIEPLYDPKAAKVIADFNRFALTYGGG